MSLEGVTTLYDGSVLLYSLGIVLRISSQGKLVTRRREYCLT